MVQKEYNKDIDIFRKGGCHGKHKKVKIDIDRYRVKENEKVNLKKFPTKRDVDIDKEEVKSTFFLK